MDSLSGRLSRIMLVEDEEDIRTVAELALESVGGFQGALGPDPA